MKEERRTERSEGLIFTVLFFLQFVFCSSSANFPSNYYSSLQAYPTYLMFRLARVLLTRSLINFSIVFFRD